MRSFRCRKALLLSSALAGVLYVGSLGHAAAQPAPVYQFDIPAENLSQSLKDFSAASSQQIVFSDDAIGVRKAPALHGSYTIDQALAILLTGTDLHVETSKSGVLMVKPKNAQAASEEGAAAPESNAPEAPETVVVTGTNIRGAYPESSPLQSYSRDQIKATGATTVTEFFEELPSNFNSLSSYAINAANSDQSQYFANGIDLRGLGVGTTLVLLNGRPLAPSSSGTTPDISLLPLDIIKKVDILTDGASAIYGADAVGGVVNFTLRDDFDGAETVAGYGGATSCCTDQVHVQQTIGQTWGTGNAVVSGGYADQTPLSALDRDYSKAAGDLNLVPQQSNWNLFGSAKQELNPRITAFTDILYSHKDIDFNSLESVGGVAERYNSPTSSADFFLNSGVDVLLTDSTTLEAVVTYSRALESQDGTISPNPGTSPFRNSDDSRDLDAMAKIDGPLFALPAGDVRYAIGGGYTEERYKSASVDPLLNNAANLGRETEYGFAELLVPVIADRQDIPAVEKLDLSLAGRFTHYSDFGNNFSPKIGLTWLPVDDLTVRGTISNSFRAPFLSQLDPGGTAWALLPAAFEPAIAAKYGLSPSSILLFANGNNPYVGPEKAKTDTVGFDVQPHNLPGFKASVTYFNIRFTGQIAEPDPTFASLSQPQLNPELFTLNPSAGQVAKIVTGATPFLNLAPGAPTSPAAVAAATAILLDDRDVNLSNTLVSGVDLSAIYSWDIWSVGLTGTYLDQYLTQVTAASPEVSRLSTVTYPPETRGRAWIGTQIDSWSGQIAINYTGSYSNPEDPAMPKVGSWTTVDLYGAYRWDSTDGVTHGLKLSLSVRNLFNTNPPFVGVSTNNFSGITEPVGFDPTNANPLGRFVSVEVTKAW